MHRGRVRPPRRSIKGDTGDFQQLWVLIRDALVDIHSRNAGKLSFEQLYRASYKIVVRKDGRQLYQLVKEFEEEWFQEKVIPQISNLITKNLVAAAVQHNPNISTNERRAVGELFLRGIKETWERHSMSMNMVADVLLYLDRGYAADLKQPSIYTVTIGLFRDRILRAAIPAQYQDDDVTKTFMAVLNAVMFDMIDMERDGDVVDRNLLRSCVQMLEGLYESDAEAEDEKLYLTTFEPQFLHNSRAYYRSESARLYRNSDAASWLRHTQRRLVEESARCVTTLCLAAEPKILNVVEAELIVARLDEFLAMEGSGLRSMIDNDRIEDLCILYQLISRVDPAKNALKATLSTRIVELGLEIDENLKKSILSSLAQPHQAEGNADAADGPDGTNKDGDHEAGGKESGGKAVSAAAQATAAAVKWVNDMLQLKDKFDRLWRDCFDSDLVIQSALTNSFTELFRICGRSSEYVSLFIDDNFKRGLRGKDDVEIDSIMDKTTTMIRFLTEKDLFSRYYQRHLARRLLHNKTENTEAEKTMISRMQQDLGRHFTYKFESMFKDVDTSADLSREYQQYIQGLGDSKAKIDLQIQVLSTNNWPTEVMGRHMFSSDGDINQGCNYPPEIQKLQRSFLQFYNTNRNGRKLSWLGSFGTADLRCIFPAIPGQAKNPLNRDRKYDLSVSTYSMVVLLLFNDPEEDKSLSFEEIQALTNISPLELTRSLGAISIPQRCRFLNKTPLTRQVRPGDVFSFNKAFVSKSVRIKAPVINAISKVEADDEQKSTKEKNDKTRNHIIDAAIVRTMKQRKELTHTALITEVIGQLASRFEPDVGMVKKRIEDLIYREYLERIEDSSPPAYRYLA